jgi:hypothetical protein
MESVLYLIVGALIGASATYFLSKNHNQEIRTTLYDQQLVNKFLKEYLARPKRKKNNGKKRYYKNQHATKAGNKVAKSSSK